MGVWSSFEAESERCILRTQGKNMDIRGMRQMKVAMLGLAASLAFALGTGPAARADFTFDPDGAGGATAVTINGFDPAVGNALGQGSVTAINNVVAAGGTGADVAANRFQLYYMATTSSLVGPSPANNPLTPPGLNTAYQITYVASVTEYVRTVTGSGGVGTTATFGVSSAQAANSGLFIYSNGPAGGIVADNAAGTGFTAGTLILSAKPIATPIAVAAGNFSASATAPVLFDQHNADNFGGKTSVSGTGSSTIDFNTIVANPAYFITPPPTVVALRFTSNQGTPFVLIEPTGAVAGTGFPNPLGAPNPIIPNLGASNGVTGPDFQFFADGNVAPVPEPSSVVLMGLGVIGLVTYTRKRRTSVA